MLISFQQLLAHFENSREAQGRPLLTSSASRGSPAAWLQVRFMARSFGVSGDHPGQQSNGYRWPFGPVALITPFNFPLEIGALQLMGALFMGNKPLVHVDHRC